jgi:MYXO-CTERM domain-containing protein
MKYINRISFATLLVLLGAPLYASLAYDVSISTSPLNGVGGYMAFDLYGGIPLQDNVATITNFSSDATLGAVTPSGDVTGTLTPGPLVLTADQAFNEWLQASTFGNSITFVLNVTTAYTGGTTPDSFAFFLLDSTQTPYGTSDPSGSDSIFSIDLTGNSTAPQVFASTASTPQFTATVTPVTATPEAGPAPLVALGLALILGLRFIPKRRSGM